MGKKRKNKRRRKDDRKRDGFYKESVELDGGTHKIHGDLITLNGRVEKVTVSGGTVFLKYLVVAKSIKINEYCNIKGTVVLLKGAIIHIRKNNNLQILKGVLDGVDVKIF